MSNPTPETVIEIASGCLEEVYDEWWATARSAVWTNDPFIASRARVLLRVVRKTAKTILASEPANDRERSLQKRAAQLMAQAKVEAVLAPRVEH